MRLDSVRILLSGYPLNISGKPYWSVPPNVPVYFELTVLISAVGMVLTFCYLCQMAPFVKKHHFHPRATDDFFVMVIEATSRTNVNDLQDFLRNAGAVEVSAQEVESGWWIGTYDKEQRLIKEDTQVVI